MDPWGLPRNGAPPFHFQAQVVMESRRVVFLNDERVAARSFQIANRLGGPVELPFPVVFVKAHRTNAIGVHPST